MIRVVALILLSIIVVSTAEAQDRFITLSSTTSTQDSGLFGHILPVFRAATGIAVHVVAVGTGQALISRNRSDFRTVRGKADVPYTSSIAKE